MISGFVVASDLLKSTSPLSNFILNWSMNFLSGFLGHQGWFPVRVTRQQSSQIVHRSPLGLYEHASGYGWQDFSLIGQQQFHWHLTIYTQVVGGNQINKEKGYRLSYCLLIWWITLVLNYSLVMQSGQWSHQDLLNNSKICGN